MTTVIVSMFFF